MIHICQITSAHSPFSLRIYYKQCRSLISKGYNVTYVVPAKKSVISEGVNIKAIPIYKGKIGRFKASFYYCIKAALKVKADVYHFHDPDLMPMGIVLRLMGKKVICDIHEDYPAKILEIIGLKEGWLHFVCRKILYGVQNLMLKCYTHNITVTESIYNKLKVKNKSIVANYPILSEITKASNLDIDTNKSDKIRLIYTGMITRIRGIDYLVRAMQYCETDVELYLLGSFESDLYYEECRSLPGWNRVVYLGFNTLQVAYKYVSSSDIGLINFLPVENHINSKPNKAFEFASFGLPMIISDFPLWRKLFSDSSVFVNPENPKEIAIAIDYLADNPELRKRLGSNAKKMIAEKYSWETEAEELFVIYDQILKQVKS